MSAPATDKRVLTLDAFPARMRVDQVAAYLNTSQIHVIRLIRTGALQALDLSGPTATKRKHYVVTKESILAFERSRKAT